MQTQLEAGRCQTISSRGRLNGTVFGLQLSVEEIVIERIPQQLEVWATTGSPRLLVIGHDRMGFEIASHANGSVLRVHIAFVAQEGTSALDNPATWM